MKQETRATILANSEEARNLVVSKRVHQLFDLIKARMEQSNTGESQMLVQMGMGMLEMTLQQMDPLTLTKLLGSCEEILSVVGKWDLHQETYEKKIETLITPLLEFL